MIQISLAVFYPDCVCSVVCCLNVLHCYFGGPVEFRVRVSRKANIDSCFIGRVIQPVAGHETQGQRDIVTQEGVDFM